MPSPELFLDPDPRDEDYDDSAPGPLDDEDEDDEDPEPVTYEDEHPDEGPQDGEGDSDSGGDDAEEACAEEEFADEDAEGQAIVDAEIAGRAPRWVRAGDLLLEYKHWRNPRTLTGLDPISLQALANDIRKKSVPTGASVMTGIEESLWVVRIARGNLVDELVIDGQRRVRALELTDLGPDALVPVRDREPEPVVWTKELAQRYFAEVHKTVALREGLSAFELSESAQDLRASNDPDTGNVYTMAKIGEILGRSESWISKILTARKSASPKLLGRWRDGEISEEQFRDLAGSKGSEQDSAADKVADARAAGDKAEARRSAREQKEIAKRDAKIARDQVKADKAAAKAKAKADKEAARQAKKQAKGKGGKGKKGPAVSGPQSDLPLSSQPEKPQPEKPAQPAPKPLQRVIVDDLITMTERKPPTHDLVKGVVLGILVASGRLDMAALPKQWHQYVNHATGTTPSKPAKKRKGK
jgi:hypothetical protein